MLLIHARSFSYRARTKAVDEAEELTDENRSMGLNNVLVVFTSVERGDFEALSSVVSKAADEVEGVCKAVKPASVLIYPYAHLSPELAPPDEAKVVLEALRSELSSRGYKAYRAPFGWYKEFTLSCHGHPLAELSKTVKAKPLEVTAEVEEREYLIMTPEGELIKPEEYEFSEGEEDFKALVLKEALKVELKGGKPRVHDYFRKFGFEWEPYSDHGHMRYGPEAALMMDLVMDYSWSVARSLGIPVFQVKGTNMFNLSVKAVKEHAKLFGDRLYVMNVGKNSYVLRYAACHQQFSMLKDWVISYKELPFGVFEIADSYRLEQPGELLLCFRLRKFYMPDLHILARDLDEAKKLSFIVHKRIHEEMRKLGRSYVTIYNVTRDFFRDHKDYILELIRREGKPALIVFYPEGKYYWVINVEYNIIDELGRPREIGTFQIDIGNAKRFNITYVDEDGSKKYPVIIHTALIGSVERYIYAVFDTAALMEREGRKPTIPTWLAPIQVRLIPVSKDYVDHCIALAKRIEGSGIRVDVDDRDMTLARKVRDAEVSWIPYIGVVGRSEVSEGVITVTIRATGERVKMKPEELINRINEEMKGYPRRPSNLPMLLSRRPTYKHV